MKVKYLFSFFALITLFRCTEPVDTQSNLQTHIEYLASDQLKGREVGTEGERQAAEYIAAHFESIGLTPYGEEDRYYQYFDFLAGHDLGDNNYLVIGESEQVLDESYYPLNFSANTQAEGEIVKVEYGISAPDMNYDDYGNIDVAGKIILINVSSPDGIHPHSKYIEYHDLKKRAVIAKDRGAKGIIFFNNDPTAADPGKNYGKKEERITLPVVFLNNHETVQEGEIASLAVELIEDHRTGRNVIGGINNQSNYFVILGAHYDHLGYGSSGNSLYRGDGSKIHNGADDNASGTALLIELARHIARYNYNKYNYLFIAFSGEERGLYGSGYFTKNPTIDLQKVNYMINMDMVGRLDTTKNSISILGTGTSPVWDSLLNQVDNRGIEFVKSESGVGPSDFTSFYLEDIPVLAFFTGTHEDYHKPSDDYDKINYRGIMKIFGIIADLTASLEDQPILEFTKTKDQNSRQAPQFSVTLGIIPDYMYQKRGLRIDGVSEGKPAAVAGIKKGDIIIKMGTLEIKDIYAYMNALSQYKKGDTVEVTALREDQEVTFEVQF